MDRVDGEKLKDEPSATEKEDEHTLVLTEPVPEDRIKDYKADEDGQSPLQAIIMIIGAIILIVLLVLFARWLYHVVHNNDQTSTGTTIEAPKEPSSPNNKSGTNQQPQSSGNNTNTKGSGQQSTGQSGQNLANTGPGNVAAVFAASTLATAGLHYIISLRRFNRSGD